MPTIRQLSPSIINKIAAGEVIERPASVVKELLENSIDAGATRIELVIESGGLDLIRISDNGCGIVPEELPLAIASHATSKLQTADDLFDVHSLGFRGEALASIAEVSHLTLRSRVPDSDVGAELQVRGGVAEPVVPVGAAVGTVMEVRHLFFNTPVRRKFLRSPQTEASHVVEAFTRIALAYPRVHMSLQSGTRQLFDLPSTHNMVERISKFFGNEIADSLIAVESEHDAIRLHGFVTDPAVSRSNNRMQYLFLNGRHIRDRSLQHALGEAYRGLLMVGRFPVCFLHLDMPAQLVDVNVHPTKLEVRFQEGGKIYSQLLQTLRHRFLSTDLTARVRGSDLDRAARPAEPKLDASGSFDASFAPPQSRDDQRWEAHADRMTMAGSGLAGSGMSASGMSASGMSASGMATGRGSPDARVARPSLPLSTTIPEFRPFATTSPYPGAANHLGSSTYPAQSHPASAGAGQDETQGTSSETLVARLGSTDVGSPAHREGPGGMAGASSDGRLSSDDDLSQSMDVSSVDSATAAQLRQDPSHPGDVRASHLGFQIHNRYLVTQDEQGMVVVDQHALHERILYEQLRKKIDQGQLESQQLLVPEPLDLTPAEAAAALESKELLARIGIQVEPFGGDTVLMTGYPAMLANMRPAEMLRQVLQPLMDGGKEPSARDLMDELLNMIACKAAIKAGDKLSPEEITALLEQRYHFQDTHHCPHGRPTALFFSREQLDKMFKRT